MKESEIDELQLSKYTHISPYTWDEPFMKDNKLDRKILIISFFGSKFEVDLDDIYENINFISKSKRLDEDVEVIKEKEISKGTINIEKKHAFSNYKKNKTDEYSYSLYEFGIILQKTYYKKNYNFNNNNDFNFDFSMGKKKLRNNEFSSYLRQYSSNNKLRNFNNMDDLKEINNNNKNFILDNNSNINLNKYFSYLNNKRYNSSDYIRINFYDNGILSYRTGTGKIVLKNKNIHLEMNCISAEETNLLASNIAKFIEYSKDFSKDVFIKKEINNKSIFITINKKVDCKSKESISSITYYIDIKNINICFIEKDKEFMFIWLNNVIGLIRYNNNHEKYETIMLRIKDYQIDQFISNSYYPILFSPLYDQYEKTNNENNNNKSISKNRYLNLKNIIEELNEKKIINKENNNINTIDLNNHLLNYSNVVKNNIHIELENMKLFNNFYQVDKIYVKIAPLDFRLEYNVIKRFVDYINSLIKIMYGEKNKSKEENFLDLIDSIYNNRFFKNTQSNKDKNESNNNLSKQNNINNNDTSMYTSFNTNENSQIILLVKTIFISEIKCCFSLKFNNLDIFSENEFLRFIKPLIEELGLRILNIDSNLLNIMAYSRSNLFQSYYEFISKFSSFYYNQLLSELIKSFGGISNSSNTQFVDNINNNLFKKRDSKTNHYNKDNNISYTDSEESNNEEENNNNNLHYEKEDINKQIIISNNNYNTEIYEKDEQNGYFANSFKNIFFNFRSVELYKTYLFNSTIKVSGMFYLGYKITSILARFFSYLTFDYQYKQRRQYKINKRIKSLYHGFSISIKMLLFSLLYIFSQFYYLPIRMIDLYNYIGLIFAIIIIILGIFFKPVIAIIDFIAIILQTISLTINDVLGNRVFRNARYKRYLIDSNLKSYNQLEALSYLVYNAVAKKNISDKRIENILVIPGYLNFKSKILMLLTNEMIVLVNYVSNKNKLIINLYFRKTKDLKLC